MPIDKLPEFSKNGQKNTDGLDQEDGFPVNLKPARQWFNFLFNKVTSTINQLIDQDYIRHDEIIDNLTTDDAAKPLSAKQGKKLQDEKFAKSGGGISGSVQLTSDNTVLTVGIDRDIGFVKKQGAGGVLAIAKDRIFRIVGGNKAEISADASDTFTDLLSLNGSGVLSTPGGFSGNASSASKLQNTRKIFGQDFDGTNDVAGNITTTTGMVAFDSYHYIDLGRFGVDRMNFAVYSGIFNFIDAQNGNVIARLNSNGIDCNAATASKLQTARTVSYSGAATGSFNFDGTASVGCILTLANSGVTASTYGSNIIIPVITFNAKGLATGVSTQTIRSASTSQTGVVQLIDDLTTDDSTKALTAKQGKKLQDEKFAKSGGSVSGSVQLTSDNTVLTVGIDRDIGFVKKQGAGGVLAIAKDRIFRIVGGNKAEISADASDTFTDLLSLNGSGVLSTPGGFSGNASSASKLQQQRKINDAYFNGTEDITITAEQRVNGGIGSEAQLNAALMSGVYICSSENGLAGLYGYGVLQVYRSGNVISQVYFPHQRSGDNQNTVGLRQTWDGGTSWLGWYYLGQKDSSKLPLAGGVLTGPLTSNSSIKTTNNVEAMDVKASGWMYAGTYTGANGNDASFRGNASSASKLQNTRNIALSGAVSGSANFDGSGNITINTTANNAIGVGQSWQDVASQRANNTIYVNTTGKPIQVFMCVNVSGQYDNSGTFAIDNVVMTIRDAAAWSHLSFIVPSGSSYKISVDSSQYNLLSWTELR